MTDETEGITGGRLRRDEVRGWQTWKRASERRGQGAGRPLHWRAVLPKRGQSQAPSLRGSVIGCERAPRHSLLRTRSSRQDPRSPKPSVSAFTRVASRRHLFTFSSPIVSLMPTARSRMHNSTGEHVRSVLRFGGTIWRNHLRRRSPKENQGCRAFRNTIRNITFADRAFCSVPMSSTVSQTACCRKADHSSNIANAPNAVVVSRYVRSAAVILGKPQLMRPTLPLNTSIE